MSRLPDWVEIAQLKYILPIALLPILVYWRGMAHGLVADDFSRLENAMAGPQGWLQFLAYTFRPFQIMVHIAQYRLFGIRPEMIHSVNLAVHILCSLLVFHLARTLTGGSRTGFLSGLAFALFPRHHTLVLWMIAIIGPFLVLFYLLAFMAFWRYLRTGRGVWHIAALLCFVLALANYETATTLPLVLLLAELLLWSRGPSEAVPVTELLQPRRYLKYLPMLVIALAWRSLAVATASIGKRVLVTELIPHSYGFRGVGVETVSDYVGYFVYQIYPHIPLRSLDINPGTMVLATASLAVIAILFWKGSNLERFLWLWVGIQFAPVVLFTPFGNDDRHFYLSSVAFVIILSLLLFRLHGFLKRLRFRWASEAPVALVAVWLITSVLVLNQRVDEWNVAGEIARQIVDQVAALYPTIDSGSEIYFVGLPDYHGRAFVMSPGIPSAVRIAYDDFDLSVRHSREARIATALRKSEEEDRAMPGVLVFQYWDGRIEDRSSTYPRLTTVFSETFWYEW